MAFTRILYVITLAVASAAVSPPASACRVASSYLHSSASYLRGNFIAEVMVVSIYEKNAEVAFEAQILSMIRGNSDSSVLKIKRQGSCPQIPQIGRKGLIMACAGPSNAPSFAITPIIESSFYIPPSTRQRDC